MDLKQRERSALLAGKFPEIVREQPEFSIGEEIVLKTTKTENGPIPEVTITILGRHKTKNGAWEAIYKVKDDRGVYVSLGLGYTRSPARALDREAPVLDDAVIEAYALEAQQANALLQGEAARRQKVESKESTVASSPRSQRAKERHINRLEAA